ncbi:IS4 family transposase [Clostridium sp. CS001]|uniref:IS4 family transposase n=1 Tax=Clostridium sp. CS001 TaxID=2880648 RepID=UPI001CF568CA|nr:IS4 family transposase [Clostridium sp. CS001]MCB2291894.1 IS4 family transposase [Clostridium sp. CS001]
MKTKRNFAAEGIRLSYELISGIIFMCETRTKNTYFTRIGNNKMTFKSIVVFMLNFVRKSLQLELDDFFGEIIDPNASVTKQAFSEARQKISPTAFVKLSDTIIKWFYEDTHFKTFKGYRILSVDGTILEVSNTENLRNEFGYTENKSMKLARARASGLFDVENEMIITAVLGKYKANERTQAEELINKLEEIGFSNDLILFDRGYPSKDLICFMEKKKLKYLMRVSTSFKSFSNVKGEDQIVEIKNNKEKLKVRVLKFDLDSGVTEILITNIFDESFTVMDFKELYFKRWGIEVKYNELKNRLQIENFTGETVIAINQDFYATVYLANMATLVKMDADVIISERNKDKDLKYEYKVNTNILIGKLKNSLVCMLLEDNPTKRSKLLEKIIKRISDNIIPIRPGRSNPRRMRLRANKNSMNKKRAL